MNSQEQGALVKGRNNFENISLTQEMTKWLHRKSRDRNIMLRIDMSKAYNRVDGRFLDHVLQTLGFPDYFVNWLIIVYLLRSFLL